MRELKRCATAGLILAITACATAPPESFIERMSMAEASEEAGWTLIELRDGIAYEDAWQDAVDIVAKKFELEMVSAEAGYARTSWTSWRFDSANHPDYRVRVILKFAPRRDSLSIKTDANFLRDDRWVVGSDTALLETLKTDIMGVVGRTTR